MYQPHDSPTQRFLGNIWPGVVQHAKHILVGYPKNYDNTEISICRYVIFLWGFFFQSACVVSVWATIFEVVNVKTLFLAWWFN